MALPAITVSRSAGAGNTAVLSDGCEEPPRATGRVGCADPALLWEAGGGCAVASSDGAGAVVSKKDSTGGN